ncbi:MAG: Gfo/Idh/MocA family protein [Planctomycetota bacterium]|jgi:predicted dehydrogenase
MTRRITRRSYLKSTAAAAGALTILPAGLARGFAANEKVNVGVIGSGGRGGANLRGVADQKDDVNIVALCDVDRGRLDGSARRFPDAKKYADFRKLLEEEKNLDAVVVSTPDHTHAPASVPAMKAGLHCYCRVMAEVAKQKNLSTHMGTPSRGNEGTVRAAEVIRSGAIGQVKEAHFWTNRPIWVQGFDRPAGEDPVPDHLDWDLWIGPAPMRPFKDKWPEGHPVYQTKWKRGGEVYHAFVWRGWWDFGTGALGDIAPHQWSPAYWGLELDAPQSVEVVKKSGPVTEMFPAATVLRFNFPVRGDRPAVPVYWYDGGERPSSDLVGMQNVPNGGQLIVGTKAVLGTGNKSASAAEFDSVPKTLRRWGGMYQEWIAGIKGSDPERPSCPFSYAGPLTEAYLLGNIALKLDQKIEWDPVKFRITNSREANQYLRREYRKGWGL